ncbi:MAG: ABC transporter permease, partial [Chloroflexi bacterium]|nr:ABC transporter permease [Chloroflexota bacterium]
MAKSGAANLSYNVAKPGRTRNPLSLGLYYRRNHRRIAPVMSILVLSFFDVALPVVIVDEITTSPTKVLGFFNQVALVWPNGREGYNTLDSGRLRQLKGYTAMYPVSLQWTTWPSLVGETPGATNVLGLTASDMQPVLGHLGNQLSAGRLPSPYSAEIAMYAPIAQRRQLKIGDKIDTNTQYEQLNEPFVLVGLIDGPAPMSIISREYLAHTSPTHQDSHTDSGWVIFPQKTDAITPGYPTLEAELQRLPQEQFVVRSYGTQQGFIGDFTNSLNTILIVLILTIVTVLSLAVGLLNYVYIIRRTGEFGVLLALGLTRGQLMRRAGLETLTMIVVAWIIGLALAETLCRIANVTLFDQQGVNMTALSLRMALHMLPVAILGSASCFLTMFW